MKNPREHGCRLKVRRFYCPSVSNKLAILPRNFARASLYVPITSQRAASFDTSNARKESITCASGIREIKGSDTVVPFNGPCVKSAIILIATGVERIYAVTRNPITRIAGLDKLFPRMLYNHFDLTRGVFNAW